MADAEICRLCLKALTEGSYFIDENLQRDFFNVTQIVLKLDDPLCSTSVCELCLHGLQFCNTLRKQFIQCQSNFLQAKNEVVMNGESTFKIERISRGDETEENREEEEEEESYQMDEIVPYIAETPMPVMKKSKTPGTKRSGSGSSSAQCDICSQSFVDKYKLKRHIQRLHMPKEATLGKYVCSECGKVFGSASNLNNHSLYHQAPKYQCEYCSKAFHEAASLRNHINSAHLNHKAYKCSMCPNEYFKQHHLNRHVLRAHKNQRFICTVPSCGKIFARKEKCRNHIRLKHKCSEYDALIKEVRDGYMDDDDDREQMEEEHQAPGEEEEST